MGPNVTSGRENVTKRLAIGAPSTSNWGSMDANRLAGGSRRTKVRTILIHTVLWAGFVVVLFLPEGIRPEGPPPWSLTARLVIGFLLLTVPPVYVHFAILERCYLRGRRLVHFAWLAVMTIAWAAIYDIACQYVIGRRPGVLYLIVILLPVILSSSTVKVLGEVGRQRSLLEEARAKQLQAELDLLKAQVHPHFLFNTLNNLFGLARNGDPATADGIARLSHLLRYMIYESARDRIDLEKEVEQIRRLIELEKLRFAKTDDIEVALTVDPDLSRARVAPMLLIPFVENAFKHGIRRSAPSFVRVTLCSDARSIHFTVENSLHPPRANAGDEPAGIGLQNVRRRLDLLYPGAHDLVIDQAGSTFRVHLRLDEPAQGGR